MTAPSSARTLVDPFASSRFDALVKVASGGMASVWVGVPRTRRGVAHLVALKRPHQHLVEDPGFKQVLVAEAAVASRLHHENVVSVRELEVVGDTVQLVMDYVEGAALGQLLVRASKGGPALPISVAVQVVLDVAAGLDVLHGLTDASGAPLGFVHRDVSPQNILVGADGRTRITDFGLAKCARASEQPTTQGTLKGKLGYMAPEYVRGAAIDHRADVFALGVVCWEALTGKRLFRGDNDADTLERVCRAPITPPSSLVPGLSPAFDAVVARALERTPEARYPSARAFGEALSAAAAGAGLVLDRRETIVHVEAAFGAEIDQRRRDLLRLLDEGTPVPEDRSARDRLRARRTALLLGGATAAAAVLLAAWTATRAPRAIAEPAARAPVLVEPVRTTTVAALRAEPAVTPETTPDAGVALANEAPLTKSRPKLKAQRLEVKERPKLPPNPYASPSPDTSGEAPR